MTTRFDTAYQRISQFFNEDSQVYRLRDLGRILKDRREEWNLPVGLSRAKFVSELIGKGQLRRITLTSESYNEVVRYIWGSPSPYAVGLSLREGAYLSHGTAVFLHSLNDQIPAVVYVNKEQSKKPEVSSQITQEGLNRAFANKQRASQYIFLFQQTRITMLSGKNTGRLEVDDLTIPGGETLPVTKIPRTLIDITVRPGYAGGVYQVLEAFRGAKDRFSTRVLITTLKKLNYKYPYHQAIGFYMSRSGYESKHLDRLKDLPIKLDFYLDYGVPENQRQYDKDWKLFYPKGL